LYVLASPNIQFCAFPPVIASLPIHLGFLITSDYSLQPCEGLIQGRGVSIVLKIEDLRRHVDEAEVPYRELGSLTKKFISNGVVYSRICDAFRGWVKLRDEELAALEGALNLALRVRAEKYNRLLAAIAGPREEVSA
jgi:hypothetical protein